jgi:hypothetical protein
MGEITRRGYRIDWFVGDHGSRHVHVYDAKERFPDVAKVKEAITSESMKK